MAKCRNHLRKNPFDDEWIMYAPNRASVQSTTDSSPRSRPSDVSCPFCAGSEEVGTDFDVLILKNRYPSFTTEPPAVSGPHEVAEGYGCQDVFLFNSCHESRLVDQTVDRLQLLLRELGKRTMELYEDPKIEAVFSFENSGPIFGPSIEHPHGQTFALPFVPKRFNSASGSCVLCQLPTSEQLEPNLIKSRGNSVLLVPPYARFPHEMWVVPLLHRGILHELGNVELRGTAYLIKCGLTAIKDVSRGMPPYMLLIYQAPRRHIGRYHLRIEIVPISKPGGGLKYLGGLELGAGVFVNPSSPEENGLVLREGLEGSWKNEC